MIASSHDIRSSCQHASLLVALNFTGDNRNYLVSLLLEAIHRHLYHISFSREGRETSHARCKDV